MAAVMIGFVSWQDGGFGWARTWWLWLIIVVFSLLVYRGSSDLWLAAGAHWVQTGRHWVDTYRLTEITIGAAGVNQVLRLTDSTGRSGSFKLRDVQKNQALWDLVYNGILHSVAGGEAHVPAGTRRILQLPEN